MQVVIVGADHVFAGFVGAHIRDAEIRKHGGELHHDVRCRNCCQARARVRDRRAHRGTDAACGITKQHVNGIHFDLELRGVALGVVGLDRARREAGTGDAVNEAIGSDQRPLIDIRVGAGGWVIQVTLKALQRRDRCCENDIGLHLRCQLHG